MYWELSRLRMERNQIAHYEPTGNETFEDTPLPHEPPLKAAVRVA